MSIDRLFLVRTNVSSENIICDVSVVPLRIGVKLCRSKINRAKWSCKILQDLSKKKKDNNTFTSKKEDKKEAISTLVKPSKLSSVQSASLSAEDIRNRKVSRIESLISQIALKRVEIASLKNSVEIPFHPVEEEPFPNFSLVGTVKGHTSDRSIKGPEEEKGEVGVVSDLVKGEEVRATLYNVQKLQIGSHGELLGRQRNQYFGKRKIARVKPHIIQSEDSAGISDISSKPGLTLSKENRKSELKDNQIQTSDNNKRVFGYSANRTHTPSEDNKNLNKSTSQFELDDLQILFFLSRRVNLQGRGRASNLPNLVPCHIISSPQQLIYRLSKMYGSTGEEIESANVNSTGSEASSKRQSQDEHVNLLNNKRPKIEDKMDVDAPEEESTASDNVGIVMDEKSEENSLSNNSDLSNSHAQTQVVAIEGEEDDEEISEDKLLENSTSPPPPPSEKVTGTQIKANNNGEAVSNELSKSPVQADASSKSLLRNGTDLAPPLENNTEELDAGREDEISRIQEEIISLRSTIKVKEHEWNSLIKLLKLKEFYLEKLNRAKEIVNLEDSLLDMELNLINEKAFKLGEKVGPNESQIFSNIDKTERDISETKNKIKQPLNRGGLRGEFNASLALQQLSERNRNNYGNNSILKSSQNKVIGEGRQGPIVEVKSIIADYRSKNAGEKGSRRKASATGSPLSIQQQTNLSYKDVLLSLAKISQQESSGSPVSSGKRTNVSLGHSASSTPSKGSPIGTTLAKLLSTSSNNNVTPTAARAEEVNPVTSLANSKVSSNNVNSENSISLANLLASAKIPKGRDNNARNQDHPAEEETIPVCQGCNSNRAQFVCAGCSSQWYCSRDCQITAWDEHSEVCSG